MQFCTYTGNEIGAGDSQAVKTNVNIGFRNAIEETNKSEKRSFIGSRKHTVMGKLRSTFTSLSSVNERVQIMNEIKQLEEGT